MATTRARDAGDYVVAPTIDELIGNAGQNGQVLRKVSAGVYEWGFLNNNEPNYGASGSQILLSGGQTDSANTSNGCEMKQFATTANSVGHGTLFENRKYVVGDTNGATAMYGSGFGSSQLSSVEFKQFASTAIGSQQGNLTTARNSVTAASDGDQVMFNGGFTGSFFDMSELKQFADAANSVSHGILGYASVRAPASASDGTQVMVQGGWTGTVYSDQNHMKLFSTNADSVYWGIVNVGKYGHAGASDGTLAIFTGGWRDEWVTSTRKHFFSDNSVTEGYGTLDSTTRRNWATKGASDGTKYVICGGITDSNQTDSTISQQFTSNSTYTSHGTLTTRRAYLDSISGN